VIAKSFERIHMSNLINFGILPLIFVNQDDYDNTDQSDEIEITDLKKLIAENKNLTVTNKTKSSKIPVNYSLTERQKQIILSGGILNWKKK
jgi:aconitate hydratase